VIRQRALLLGLVLFGLLPVEGQTVRGTVTRDGVRVDGAIVLLLDSAGRVVARGTSRESGTFSLAADRPGRYAVRVLRIGYAPTTAGPLQLASGTTTPLDVQLTGKAVRIGELRIVDRAPCEVRPDSDAVAFRLWDEARKALLATTLTQAEPLTMRLSSTQQRLDRDGVRVLAESIDVRTVPTVRPFVSLPPDSLAANGYVRRNALNETIYWAPDADVLLSEAFASTHCLRPQRSPADTGVMAHWVGIAFLPSGEPRGIADVEGVLWLDQATGELRRLDYRYVNLPEFARLAERVRAGGRVEFLRLPNGGWIIPRWSIRYPSMRAGTVRAPVAVVPGLRRDLPTEPSLELAGVLQTAGEVAEVRRGARTIWERGRVGYRVRVMDAERGLPVARAVLAIDDSRDTVTAGPDGVALFPRVVAGPHRLAVRTATMTLLGTPALELGVVVPAEQEGPHQVMVLPEHTSLARACGARVAARHESLLRGSLRTTALPVADTRVEASWQASYARLGGGAPVMTPRRMVATTNARGEFVMCGLPRGIAVALRPLRGRPADAATTVMIPSFAVAAEERIVVEP
jgi:hypothetical protein